MPSIRIKRGSYTTLESSRPRRPTLSTIFTSTFSPAQNDEQPAVPLSPRTPVQTPIITPSDASRSPMHHSAPSPRRKLRRGSIIFDNVVGRSPQIPAAHHIPYASADSTTSLQHIITPTSSHHSREGFVTIEGPSANVLMQSTSDHSYVGSALSFDSSQHHIELDEYGEPIHHHDDIVEHLDVIDPQMATVANLTNAANTILIPPMSFYSRKPVVLLSRPSSTTDEEAGDAYLDNDLDRHVNDLLRRRATIRRMLKGVWSFLKTPMGILAGIYGFLVVFWGAAIVIFLLKIINFHNAQTQGFWVEISSQVVNGLFTITGVGLIPSRTLDTYRISKIIHYQRKTARMRREAGLPALYDKDDLPDPVYDPNYVHVLTEKEQKDLHRQQLKFQHHQTWYRPHGTETHRAFPINYALLICLFNDGNSIFQVILCTTMWSLNRFQRPAWSTGTLIPLSFLCGITSAVLIGKGGSKTKRTKKVEARLRAALAAGKQTYDDEILRIAANLENDNDDTRGSMPPSPTPTQEKEVAGNDTETSNVGTSNTTDDIVEHMTVSLPELEKSSVAR